MIILTYLEEYGILGDLKKNHLELATLNHKFLEFVLQSCEFNTFN